MERFREIAPGVLVATADLYTTTSTVVMGDDAGCLVIDPAVSAADLVALAGDLSAAGLRPRAGFATHPHWDHVLWSAGLGDAPRYAAPRAVTAAQARLGKMTGQVEAEVPGHDLSLIGRLVPLPDDAGAIPWDGPAAQVIVHDGHAPGHGAVFLPATGVLVAGDMLSDIEIPLLDLAAPDPMGDYRAGLARLAAAPEVSRLVPGHGSVAGPEEFHRRVAADERYLDQLEAGRPFDDPRLGQDWLRAVHADQLRRYAR